MRSMYEVERTALRVVLVLAAGAARGGRRASAPERIEAVRAGLIRGCARVLAEHGMHGLVGGRGETLVMIIPDRPPDAVRELGDDLCSLGAERGVELSVGVSAPVRALGQYPVAGRQAAYACSATRQPDGPVTVFEDLGAVQFLLEPAHGEDLDRYADRQLGALLAYDRDHDADLVETLAAYLRCDGQVQRAAESLGIHPKTMSYRLGRIEKIAGMVVTSQEDRFNAQLALKILAIRSAGRDAGRSRDPDLGLGQATHVHHHLLVQPQRETEVGDQATLQPPSTTSPWPLR